MTVIGLIPGECGSIVVDQVSFEVYGHVIGSNVLGHTYVVPLIDTIEQIRLGFNARTITLPLYDSNSAPVLSRDFFRIYNKTMPFTELREQLRSFGFKGQPNSLGLVPRSGRYLKDILTSIFFRVEYDASKTRIRGFYPPKPVQPPKILVTDVAWDVDEFRHNYRTCSVITAPWSYESLHSKVGSLLGLPVLVRRMYGPSLFSITDTCTHTNI